MPKATLTLNLPEEFDIAVNARFTGISKHKFYNYLRNKIKYSAFSENELKIYEEVRDKFCELFEGE